MSEPLLTVENLSIAFTTDGEEVLAVQGAGFDLYPGEVLGIVGESGSGKSITCLSIMGLLSEKAKVKSGLIYFRPLSENLLHCKEEALQKIRGKDISMIFQEPMSSLNPVHRCGEQVVEAILIHRKISYEAAKAEVIDLFKKVQIRDPFRAFSAYPHELSGGQLQRVMIAMALANKPKIIIADEPTTALDVTVQHGILDLLLSLKSDFGCAVIFISHDLGVIRRIADRVVVMQRGRVVESGDTETIFSNATHAYTKGLIACRPPFDQRLKRLPTVHDFLERTDEEQSNFLYSLIQSEAEYQDRQRQIMLCDTVLEVDHLSKWYVKERNWYGKATAYTKAVDDVSFQMKKGEILGLVGESGCGKSTLGRCILQLIPPTAGRVMYEGINLRKLGDTGLRNIRKDIQIIFQDPFSSLNPKMKIGEAIMEPMLVHGIGTDYEDRRLRVLDLMARVGLKAEFFDRYPHQFSGGQRQRISIARTLSLQPKFIVCDESVSALDVSVQAQVLNLLLDLKNEFDLSYLFISHDMGVVKFFCDRVMVMEQGKLVEIGAVESIFHDAQHPYTQKLIQAVLP